jgi:hypothetical protein
MTGNILITVAGGPSPPRNPGNPTQVVSEESLQKRKRYIQVAPSFQDVTELTTRTGRKTITTAPVAWRGSPVPKPYSELPKVT